VEHGVRGLAGASAGPGRDRARMWVNCPARGGPGRQRPPRAPGRRDRGSDAPGDCLPVRRRRAAASCTGAAEAGAPALVDDVPHGAGRGCGAHMGRARRRRPSMADVCGRSRHGRGGVGRRRRRGCGRRCRRLGRARGVGPRRLLDGHRGGRRVGGLRRVGLCHCRLCHCRLCRYRLCRHRRGRYGLCRYGLRRNGLRRSGRRRDRRCRSRHALRWRPVARRQHGQRVDVALLLRCDPHSEMHVGLRLLRVAARPDRSGWVALGDRRALVGDDRAQMRQGDDEPVGRSDRDGLARRWDGPGERHRSGRGRQHRPAGVRTDVDPAVLPAAVRARRVENERL
jgi:hypothetical protein